MNEASPPCPYCRTGVCYAHDTSAGAVMYPRYPGLGEALQRERDEAATAQRHREICRRLDRQNELLADLVAYFTGRVR